LGSGLDGQELGDLLKGDRKMLQATLFVVIGAHPLAITKKGMDLLDPFP
jgi:hypothetical protein